ncbi:TetR/AcrR family transcriptional regulator [Paenochrobactrum pullorum]|uniref:TetR/AcrR family transcriptional regulator n=1 Tax=Paenochrobactrum pullorum TaxID=1324351 RepID=UPI0035BC71EF
MARKINPEQHEAKRQEILAAAHDCFLAHGLQGASISMICKEAGMSPGHLYHYFASKDAIVEAMADDYLKKLHAYFDVHSESDETATVLVSELWSMKSWTEVEHCRITFELFAEAARNENVRQIMIANTDNVRQLLIATLRAGQARGDVDASFDPEHTSAVLISLIYAAPMIPLIAPQSSFETSRGLITMMIRKFLKPAA